jgi:hypothetical protein
MAKSVKSVKDVDPWYESHKLDLSTHLTMVDKSHRNLDKLSKAQRSVGLAYAELAARLSDLSSVEPNRGLSNGYLKFAKSFEKTGSLYQTIGDTQVLRMSDHFTQESKACESADVSSLIIKRSAYLPVENV